MERIKIEGPLNGIRVIDFSTYLAGPKAAKLLADWGADVIRVDTTGAVASDGFNALYGLPDDPKENPLLANNQANKRTMRVNMKTPEGAAIMAKLLSQADVLITNFRENALKRLGMDYETLHEKYPRLVYGYVTGYGTEGPDAQKSGFDSTAYWARGGLLASIGEPYAPPPVPLAGFGDTPTSVFLVAGILAALHGRERTGKGQRVVGALYNTAIYNLCQELATANYGKAKKKSVWEPTSPLINVYQCKDGKWISLTSLNYRKEWAALCGTFGRPDLVDDPRCNSPKAIYVNRKEVTGIFAEIIAQKDREEWARLWLEADIPFELVQELNDILTDEQARANNFVMPCKFQNGNTAYLVGTPAQLSDVKPNPYANLITVGQHTSEVLAELGYSEAQIAELIEQGVVQNVKPI